VRAYVVDDQRAIVELLTLLLEEIGVEVTGTTDSTEARERIAAARPDIVFLDIMMPKIDGLTLLDELQRDPRTTSIPIVLCTASVLSPSQSRLFADTGIGVLSKPFDTEQLQAIVDAVRARS